MTKRQTCSLIEKYINRVSKNTLESWYGKNTKIKVKSINQVFSDNSIIIDVVIVLGDTINEEVLERAIADQAVYEAVYFFYPENPVKIVVGWDV